MSRTGARILLGVSCLLAAAAVFQSFRFSQSHITDRQRLVAIEREAGALETTLTELRGAQMAYLAAGQGPEFWMRRASELADQLQAGLARARETSETTDAQAALTSAETTLASLVQLDTRARRAVSADQKYLASDLVFTDAVTGAQQIVEAVQAARAAEQSAIEARLDREGLIQFALFPAALLLILASAWTAGHANRPKAPALSEAEEVAEMLRKLPPPVKAPGVTAVITPPVATPPARTLATPAAGDPVPAAPPAPAASIVSLTDAAELCVDLARVLDAADMPSLLQRAARTLDASGMIVWVIDTTGQTLAPALTHGYSERVLAKLKPIDVQADNVTSLSFRSMRPQTMPGAGRDGASSAIAVPLITSDGCNGVLAAEVPGPRPADERVAVARILAAQLAAMLSPIEPPARKAAEA